MRTTLIAAIALLAGLTLGLVLGTKIGFAKAHQLQEATRG
jgi:hypothetical protein